MDRVDFAQGVVRTRVIEKRLLSKAHMLRLMDADGIEGVFKILNDTEYSQSISLVKDYGEYEKVLLNELIRVYDLMRDVSPHQSVVDLLALKYDYHNLKVLLKGRCLNKNLSYLYVPVGTADFNNFYKQFQEDSSVEVDETETGHNEFKKAMEAAETGFGLNHDPQKIDLILDQYYYNHLYHMALKTNVDLFIDYVRDMIDFINIISFIRLHKQKKSISFFENVILPNGNVAKNDILENVDEPVQKLIEIYKDHRINNYLIKGLQAYEKSGTLTELEKCMDNYLMELNKTSKSVIFGPEPIFSYVLAKEVEIKNLRIIMVSKVNNIAPEVIRERLRDLYV